MKETNNKPIIEIPPNHTPTQISEIWGEIAIRWQKLTPEQRQQILEKIKQYYSSQKTPLSFQIW